MRYSNTTLRELKSRYKHVLLKCAFLNAVLLMGLSVATTAGAATDTGTPTDIKIGEQNVDGGRIWLKGLEKGIYTHDEENYTLELTPDNGEIKLASISASIQTTKPEYAYPTVRIVGDSNTTLNMTTSDGQEVSIFSRFAPLYVGTKDSPLGTINIVNNDSGYSSIYITDGNDNVNKNKQDLQIYADNISINSGKGSGVAITGNEGKMTLVANNTLDITGSIEGFNDIYGGHANMTININQNEDNRAVTNIVGNITSAVGSQVNIGLKGDGSSVTGNLIVSDGGTEFPGGFINLSFGKNGRITGDLIAKDEGEITISSEDLVGIFGDISISENSAINLNNVELVSGSITNEGTLNLTGQFKAALSSSTALITGSGSTTGEATLLISEAGTYKIFGSEQTDITFSNTLYDIKPVEDGAYEISKKATDEIAESVVAEGATANEAEAIAAVAGATSTDETVNAVLNEISTAIQEGDTKKAAAIVKAVNPEVAPVSRVAAASNAVLGAVATRMSSLGAAPAPTPATRGRSGGDVNVKLSPWVQGLYNKTHNSQADGFDAYTQGFAFGADVDLTDAWTVGIGYAYTATDVKSDRKTQIYGDNVFAYAQYKPENWYINAVASYGKSNYKQDGTFSAEYDADSYSGQVLTGYDAGLFDTYTGVRYNYIKTDAYNNGIANIKSKNTQIGTFVLGTRISQDIQVKKGFFLTPEFRLAGTYDFKSDNARSTVGIIGSTASYTVTGDRMSRGAVEAGIGLTATVNNFELKFDYDAALRSENNTQGINLKAIYHF